MESLQQAEKGLRWGNRERKARGCRARLGLRSEVQLVELAPIQVEPQEPVP